MRDIIDALTTLLQNAGLAVHYVQAPRGAAYPYVLLWSSAGQPGIESSVTGNSDMSDLLGVTMVDTYPENVLLLASNVRAQLAGATLTVPQTASDDDWLVTLSLSVSQTVQADEQATLPDTSLHPYFAVDRYQLVATPA